MNKGLGYEILKLREKGKSYNEIKSLLKCSKGTISYHASSGQKEKSKQSRNRNRARKKMAGIWSDELLVRVVELMKEGKNCTEISKLINYQKKPDTISKKLRRMGYMVNDYVLFNGSRLGKYEKYKKINWKAIQLKYNEGVGYSGIQKIFNLSPYAISWAKENNLLKLNTVKEGIRIARALGKYPKSDKDGIVRYRQLSEFKFNVYDYPDEFDFKLIKKHGWYKAKNNGNNLYGVSRDHMYSIKEGFRNNISPDILAHPANCQLILHSDNSAKRNKCSISLQELKVAIMKWDNKYGQVANVAIGTRLQNVERGLDSRPDLNMEGVRMDEGLVLKTSKP